ncbi:MAG: hypothetical protein WBM28_04000 [Burkholderiales bacterium]
MTNHARITVWIGMALLVFTLGLVPGVNPPTEPNQKLLDLAESSLRDEGGGKVPSKADVDRRYDGFMTEQWVNWAKNVFLFAVSFVAIVLTVWRKSRIGLWLALLLCAIMLFNYVPPLVRLSDIGFIKFATIVLNSSMKRETLDGALLFWHVIVAPFAYALLALAVVLALALRRQSEAS